MTNRKKPNGVHLPAHVVTSPTIAAYDRASCQSLGKGYLLVEVHPSDGSIAKPATTFKDCACTPRPRASSLLSTDPAWVARRKKREAAE